MRLRRHCAIEVLKNSAADLFPGVPVITSGDIRSEASLHFWSTAAIWNRLDQHGLPLIIAGWPCDGDSAQNAKQVNKEGLSHPSTSTLNLLSHIRRAVITYLGTPRVESSPQRSTLTRRLHNA